MHLKNDSVTSEQAPDTSQTLDLNYYRYLLEQHNHDRSNNIEMDDFENQIKMEHNYTRDWQPKECTELISRRTIMIENPPECSSCHMLATHEERFSIPLKPSNIKMPEYDEETGRSSMNEIKQIVANCPNQNSDNDDWTENIIRFGWTNQQIDLFTKIENILDLDQLARLAIESMPNECLRRRSVIEKSASRFRQAMASIHWNKKLRQWLHELLCKHLPPKYMASYIEILQSLKKRVPTLIDELLFERTDCSMNQTYLNTILQQAWEPNIKSKLRPLPRPSVIIVVPSSSCSSGPSTREKRWCELLGALAQVQPIYVNLSNITQNLKSMEHIADQLTAIARAKIQEVRKKMPEHQIILIGFGIGASIAIQSALVHKVNSVICIGFAFNTIYGTRGNIDDKILSMTTPILFVIGDNAQRTSPEEIELLREKIPAQTSLIVVGSTDDHLRVDKTNHVLKGVTQSMVDNIIVEEIREFALICLLYPPKPRQTYLSNGAHRYSKIDEHQYDYEPKHKKTKFDKNIYDKYFSQNIHYLPETKPIINHILINSDMDNNSTELTAHKSSIKPIKQKSENNDLELLDIDETDLLNANILDMPISFADLDECIEESICEFNHENNINNNNNNNNEIIGFGASIKLNGTAKLIKLPSCDKTNFDFIKNQQLINLKTSINQMKM